MTPDQIRTLVRDRYGAIVGAESSCCGPKPQTASSCCAPQAPDSAEMARRMGYDQADIDAAGAGNLGLGCGNPQAIAALQAGEVVVDLGAGAGFDAFLAARQVGADGLVIGVDMTPQMLSKARANATALNLTNVEFRLGEIEHLPIADGVADVIISNCVINLSPDKWQVFREAFRVLKPGGRLAISDVVKLRPLPLEMANSEDLIAGCIGGAAFVADLELWLTQAGFADIRIQSKAESRDLIHDWAPGQGVEDYVVSASIEARKA